MRGLVGKAIGAPLEPPLITNATTTETITLPIDRMLVETKKPGPPVTGRITARMARHFLDED